jgi:glyoxylate/hydroxypyruvate reductase A
LKLIISKGFGVDHLFKDPALPRHVPIVRLVDPSAVSQMTQYVVHATLRYHRRMDEIEDAWRRGEWQKVPPPDTGKTVVGVLGLGVLGRESAEKLASLGFTVRGWSRTEKEIPGIACFHGAEGLKPFLGECRIVICLLALTPETEGILCAETFSSLADLIAALDSAHLGGATLDVFQVEPLESGHPFWRHPKVRVTPHIAADGVARTAAPIVAENMRRVDAGEPLLHQVDPTRGY